MSSVLSADAEGTGVTPDEGISRALVVLKECLAIVDSIDAPPQIGARILEVIESLEELQEQFASS